MNNIVINENTKIHTQMVTNNIEQYFLDICNKVSSNINFSKGLEKLDNETIYVPNFNESHYLCRYKYNMQHLKLIAKTYKLKVTGSKPQLLHRIYSYLVLSNYSVKIQKYVRGYIYRKYMLLHGPAYINRSLCTNTYDFLSMDELTNIPFSQFFSFKDEDGFVYGFDLVSFYNLICKSNSPSVKNPYNQQIIASTVIDQFRILLRISRLLKIYVSVDIIDVNKEVSDAKSVELRGVTLFQNIDALGNYSNAQWFLSLNRLQLIRFVRELMDIWAYRAPLTMETKRSICPPSGNPFSRIASFHTLQTQYSLDEVRKAILGIMERFVNTGVDKDNKCLGAYYVLGALTLVSQDAADALPWLYQAVCYM